MINEYFLDDVMVERYQGNLTRKTNQPVKQGVVFGDPDNETWDKDKNYFEIKEFGEADYRMWYCGIDSSSNLHTCYATSTDGLSWTKPNLGLISYEGNTNNNIVQGHSHPMLSMDYKAERTPPYIITSIDPGTGTTLGAYLYSSSDGLNWSAYKTVFASTGFTNDNYREGKSIFETPNGTYLLYYGTHHPNQRRSIAAFRSATSDLTGSWQDLGILIDAQSQDEQRYSFKVKRYGDVYLGIAGEYNKTTEKIVGQLWVSRDMFTWKQLDKEWIPLGNPGEFDDSMSLPCFDLIEVGDEWRCYFCGNGEPHNVPGGARAATIGYATIGRGRLWKIQGNGTVVTKLLTIGEGDTLRVNGDGISCAVLDSDQTQVPGYESEEVPGDVFYSEVTWSGQTLPVGTYRLKFTISAGTLYSYTVGP